MLTFSDTFISFFQGHSAEIISLSFNTTGDKIITGSFDHTVSVWDVGSGRFVNCFVLYFSLFFNDVLEIPIQF